MLPKCTCGRKVIERKNTYTCDCGLIIKKFIAERDITHKILEDLLESGRTITLDGFKSFNGKTFKAIIVLQNRRAVLEFPNRKYSNSNKKDNK